MNRPLISWALASLLLTAPLVAASFKPLPIPAGFRLLKVVGLSPNGKYAVGSCSNSPTDETGALWNLTGATITVVKIPGMTVAKAVSDDGTVICGYKFGKAAVYRPETGIILQGSDAQANGVSADGVVIGGTSGGQAYVSLKNHGLSKIPKVGTRPPIAVTEVSDDGQLFSGFLYNRGSRAGVSAFVSDGVTTQDLGLYQGKFTTSFDISQDKSTVVGQLDSGNPSSAFYWTAATGIVALPNLPGNNIGAANGVSADGSLIVGASGLGALHPIFTATLWTAAGGVVSIQSVLTRAGINTGGGTLQQATEISANGKVVVGVGTAPTEGWVAILP